MEFAKVPKKSLNPSTLKSAPYIPPSYINSFSDVTFFHEQIYQQSISTANIYKSDRPIRDSRTESSTLSESGNSRYHLLALGILS